MEPASALTPIVTAILASYQERGELAHVARDHLPSREIIWAVVQDLLRLLFPGFLEPAALAADELADRTAARVRSIEQRLHREIEKGCRFRAPSDTPFAECRDRAATATLRLLERIPAIRDALASDIEAAFDGDPAAHSFEEIILAYPGLQAIAVYRLAHELDADDIPIVPRVMSEFAHSRTGIDIHPGAVIGRRFFIDHGTGVVIGATSVIGDNVKLYQGVTLGARSFPRDNRGRIIKGTKRHPDIEDDVTIYAGATILGPVRIGRGSVIGGNVWLTQSVPPETRIVVRTPQQMQLDSALDFQI
ncbi:MAG TPA: serine O-acetyltransferase EpsC [Candidatus Binatia bacterium]|jgi:serine O-acetyltransferase|nr:serine O-acetyltransferase EpsC [Candidatus Binatia bacterium]